MKKLVGKTQILQDLKTIIKQGSTPVYFNNGIENEEVEVEIIKRIKEGYSGKIVKIKKPSIDRVKPICPVYEKCGGCQLMHITYAKQLQLKKQAIEKAAKQLHLKIHDVIGMNKPYFYRNKLISSFQKNRKNQLVYGLYSEFSHELVPIKKCYLHDEIGDELISIVGEVAKELKIAPYEEDRKKGFLRHVLVRRAVLTKETMLILIVSNKNIKILNLLKKKILEKTKVDTIVANINNKTTNMILADEEMILHGKGYIVDELCGLKFRISPKSFYQINHSQTEKLYTKALSLCKFNQNDVVIDTYSGIGTIGFIISSHVQKVISVELNKDASKDAILNAKINKLHNVEVVNADATKYMQQLAHKKQKVDVVIMDPTRAGSTKEFMDSCSKLRVKKIVYISCNPFTQIRDIEYFKKLGYTTKEMFLYDLFPNTNHIESIVLLEKR